MGKSGALEKKVSEGTSEPRPEMRLLSKNSEDKPPAWTQGDEELKVKNVNLHYLETLQKHLGILFPIPYQNLFFFF